MFDLDVNSVRTDILHRYTLQLLELINRFLAQKLVGCECYLDHSNSQHRYSNVFLQLINYSSNSAQGSENWVYRIKFPFDPDRQLEIQGAALALAELFRRANGASTEIDFEKTFIELSITKRIEYQDQYTRTIETYDLESGARLHLFDESAEFSLQNEIKLLEEFHVFSSQDGNSLYDLIVLFNGVNLVPQATKYTEKLEFIPKLEWKRLEEGTLYLDEAQSFKARLTIKGVGTAPDLRQIPPNSPLKVKSSITLVFNQTKSSVLMEMITSNYCINMDKKEQNWIWQLEQI